MKIFCLTDDTPGEGFGAEHGLSVYVETKSRRILVDCGQTGLAFRNAEKLGIDIAGVDVLILSHGHYDHTGGVMEFRRINSKAKIYIRHGADGDFYNLKNGNEKYIGADKALFTLPGVILTDGNVRIDEELSLFTKPGTGFAMPAGNSVLVSKTARGFVPDDFSHEQYAVVNDGGKYVLISGCAHRGILNILYEFRKIYGCDPGTVITGFHTVKSAEYTGDEAEELEGIARKLMSFDSVFYTGHCTGKPAFEIFKKIMGDRVHPLFAGAVIKEEEERI